MHLELRPKPCTTRSHNLIAISLEVPSGKGIRIGILRREREKATSAEKMIVIFARSPDHVVMLRGAFGDFEDITRDQHIGGISCARPFLAMMGGIRSQRCNLDEQSGITHHAESRLYQSLQ